MEIDGILKKISFPAFRGSAAACSHSKAIIKNPSVLFCDEATGALDEASSKKVVELLHSIQSTFGIEILFVTHNVQITETADRIITVKDGLVSQDRINENPISSGEADSL